MNATAALRTFARTALSLQLNNPEHAAARTASMPREASGLLCPLVHIRQLSTTASASTVAPGRTNSRLKGGAALTANSGSRLGVHTCSRTLHFARRHGQRRGLNFRPVCKLAPDHEDAAPCCAVATRSSSLADALSMLLVLLVRTLLLDSVMLAKADDRSQSTRARRRRAGGLAPARPDTAAGATAIAPANVVPRRGATPSFEAENDYESSSPDFQTVDVAPSASGSGFATSGATDTFRR